ncbi:hypothetical protein ACH5RR_008835 [Cinchona calisaya]|uniref:Uncharacterized protein n=1 Tax=Cinchona calisaya TaxID=153742 RepID=A0ABD3AD80_9GENT
MERYVVPKPLAKDLAQEDSFKQLVSSSIGLSMFDEFSERVEIGLGGSLQLGSSTTFNVASTAVFKEVDSMLVASVISLVKDQGITGKVIQHVLKANKNMGFSYDNEKNLSCGEVDGSCVQFSDPNVKVA